MSKLKRRAPKVATFITARREAQDHDQAVALGYSGDDGERWYWPGRYEEDLIGALDYIDIVEEAPTHCIATTVGDGHQLPQHNFSSELPYKTFTWYLEQMHGTFEHFAEVNPNFEVEKDGSLKRFSVRSWE